MAIIFGDKHAIDNWEQRWKVQVFSTLSQNFVNHGPQTA